MLWPLQNRRNSVFDIEELLTKYQLDYTVYNHRAVLSYADADQARIEAGFTGMETKTLLLKDHHGQVALYFMPVNKRADFKQLQLITNHKFKIVQEPVLFEQLTKCRPGCLTPFGYPSNYELIVDTDLLTDQELVFSKRNPQQTIQMNGLVIKQLLDYLTNPVYLS